MSIIPQLFRLIGNRVIDLLYLKLGGQGSPSSFILLSYLQIYARPPLFSFRLAKDKGRSSNIYLVGHINRVIMIINYNYRKVLLAEIGKGAVCKMGKLELICLLFRNYSG